MIEKIILDYLLEALNVDVYLEKPDNPPERYVLIEKTSGSKENHISKATFAVQSYAESLFFAAELNGVVVNAMDNLVKLKDQNITRIIITQIQVKKYIVIKQYMMLLIRRSKNE